MNSGEEIALIIKNGQTYKEDVGAAQPFGNILSRNHLHILGISRSDASKEEKTV
jgi:hypothetical protein